MRSSQLSIVVFSLVCLMALASAAKMKMSTQIAIKAVATPGGDLTAGIIDGMAYVAGVPNVCNKAHQDAYDDFVQGTQAFSDAFTVNIPNPLAFERGLRLYGNGISSVADSLETCGLNMILSNWTKVADQMRQNPGQAVANLFSAMAHRIDSLHLQQLIHQINTDLANGNNYNAGVGIGTIIATILTPKVPDLTFLRMLQLISQLLVLPLTH